MPPQSPLKIATSALERLIKEYGSYENELMKQTDRLRNLKEKSERGKEHKDRNVDDDGEEDLEGNREFELKQQQAVVNETKEILPGVEEKVREAVTKLEEMVEVERSGGGDKRNSVDDLKKAEFVLDSYRASPKFQSP